MSVFLGPSSEPQIYLRVVGRQKGDFFQGLDWSACVSLEIGYWFCFGFKKMLSKE